MKKLVISIGLFASMLACCAQDNQPSLSLPPEVKAKAFELIKATNESWLFAFAPSYSPELKNDKGEKKEWGFSALAGYWITPYILTGIRGEYFAGNFFAGEASATAQLPMKFFGKTVTPFTTAAIATPLTGGGNDNFDAIAIAGVGVSANIYNTRNIRFNIMVEAEKWMGALGNPMVYHGGIVINFPKFWK